MAFQRDIDAEILRKEAELADLRAMRTRFTAFDAFTGTTRLSQVHAELNGIVGEDVAFVMFKDGTFHIRRKLDFIEPLPMKAGLVGGL